MATYTENVMYPVTQYIWDPDRVLAKIEAVTGNIYYYLYNGHGDVVQIVDTSGTIKNAYDYDVWGNFLKKEETIENHFTYFCQTYDKTTGMDYLRARYYDPTTGRFTQQDPAEDGYNWYVYGNQNPVVYGDWTGEFAGTATVVGIGTVEVIKGIAAIAGGVTIGKGIVYFAKKSKSSKKERATDIPSWAKGNEPKEGENGKDYAKRLCDERYGKGLMVKMNF